MGLEIRISRHSGKAAYVYDYVRNLPAVSFAQSDKQSGLAAFLGLSTSSRRGDKSAIGHKGLGVKSYFLSDSGLIVVTKTAEDADWSYLHIPHPMEWLRAEIPTASQLVHVCITTSWTDGKAFPDLGLDMLHPAST